jgi:YegS/Rv2252/BmrU family lipid kinase
MQPAGLKFLFIVNPVSGGKTKNNWEAAIREFFKPLSHTIEVFVLDGKNDAVSMKHYIESIKPDRVVAVGGDGTISLTAKQLLGTNIPLGILPAGSANGMAKELNIKLSIEDALNTLVKGEVRDVDVIRINNEYFCLHLSDIGLNARLVHYFEQNNLRGMVGYFRVLLKTLLKQRRMMVSIDTPDQTVQRDALMVVLANATKYGTGAVINPDGDLSDGMFEVVVVKKLAVSELFKMLISKWRFNPNKVEVFHTKHVLISTKHTVHFQIDGEYLGKVRRVEAVIEGGKLKLILPT